MVPCGAYIRHPTNLRGCGTRIKEKCFAAAKRVTSASQRTLWSWRVIERSRQPDTTEQEVRNLFPMHAYNQKQLSSVGVCIGELKRFVEQPIKHVLD